MPKKVITVRSDGWIEIEYPTLVPWRVALLVRKVDGVHQVLGLELHPPLGEDGTLRHGLRIRDVVLTDEAKRALPLARLREVAVEYLGGKPGRAFRAMARVEREPGKAWSDDHFAAVAEVYRRAVDAGRPPLKEIQDEWGVRRAAAAKWVKRARDLGRPRGLGPSIIGKPGEQDPPDELKRRKR